jgi:6-phosphogluconolactonase
MRQLTIDGADVAILDDEAAVAREAASRTVAVLGEALSARGVAHVALTGGSSAVALYRELASPPFRDAIDWQSVHMWWGDERFVPRDHPESNAGLAFRTLFAIAAFTGESGAGGSGADVEAGAEAGLVVDAEKVHPIETEEAIANGSGPAWAAQAYVTALERLVPRGAGGIPAFDVILLGVGPDGHTLSIFPGSSGLAEDAPIVLPVDAPEHVEPRLARVTLAARVLPAASRVLVMSAGDTKAEMLAQVLGPERSAARWPAQAAILPNATWLVDEAAAAGLSTG